MEVLHAHRKLLVLRSCWIDLPHGTARFPNIVNDKGLHWNSRRITFEEHSTMENIKMKQKRKKEQYSLDLN